MDMELNMEQIIHDGKHIHLWYNRAEKTNKQAVPHICEIDRIFNQLNIIIECIVMNVW